MGEKNRAWLVTEKFSITGRAFFVCGCCKKRNNHLEMVKPAKDCGFYKNLKAEGLAPKERKILDGTN